MPLPSVELYAKLKPRIKAAVTSFNSNVVASNGSSAGTAQEKFIDDLSHAIADSVKEYLESTTTIPSVTAPPSGWPVPHAHILPPISLLLKP